MRGVLVISVREAVARFVNCRRRPEYPAPHQRYIGDL